MNKNENLLDSEVKQERTKKEKTRSYYENRTIIYLVCMLGGGLIYSAFLTVPKFNIPLDSFIYTVSAIITALPIEAFRKYRRDKKNKKKSIEEKDDPLWFHVIESALSLLIIMLVLSFILIR